MSSAVLPYFKIYISSDLRHQPDQRLRLLGVEGGEKEPIFLLRAIIFARTFGAEFYMTAEEKCQIPKLNFFELAKPKYTLLPRLLKKLAPVLINRENGAEISVDSEFMSFHQAFLSTKQKVRGIEPRTEKYTALLLPHKFRYH